MEYICIIEKVDLLIRLNSSYLLYFEVMLLTFPLLDSSIH